MIKRHSRIMIILFFCVVLSIPNPNRSIPASNALLRTDHRSQTHKPTMTKYQTRYIRKIIRGLNRNDPKTTKVALSAFTFLGEEHQLLAQLAMSLVGNTHMRILCLVNCGITSKGAHLLAYALRENTSLCHVWLNGNDIGSSGAGALASSLRTNTTLLTLGLADNTIGNTGGKALARALRENETITNLLVDGNRMSMRVEDEIERVCYGSSHRHPPQDEGCSGSQGEGDEILAYPFPHDEAYGIDHFDYGCCSSTETDISASFVNRTLDSIKEVEYEDNDENDDSPSTTSRTENDMTGCYQVKKESKLSKFRALTRSIKITKSSVGNLL